MMMGICLEDATRFDQYLLSSVNFGEIFQDRFTAPRASDGRREGSESGARLNMPIQGRHEAHARCNQQINGHSTATISADLQRLRSGC
jgi:hypothetical protein